MPLQKLQFRPGVSRESTTYANEGAWYQCDKIRFRSGMPEKIGGWQSYGTGSYDGTCRHFVEWVSLSGYYLLGVGTNLKYYILTGGVYYDITPIRTTIALPDNPFYTMYVKLNTGGPDLSATETVIPTTSIAAGNMSILAPFVVKIDNEYIYVPAVSTTSNTLGTPSAPCIRGYQYSTATTHADGSGVSSARLIMACPGNGASIGDFVEITNITGFYILSTQSGLELATENGDLLITETSLAPYTTTTLNAEYQVANATSAYVAIITNTQSIGAYQGGGVDGQAQFLLSIGANVTTVLGGWGAGPWVGLQIGSGSATLASAIDATTTTIPVVSVDGFPNTGNDYLYIESELIKYTGINVGANTFTGCTRGVSDNATSHEAGIYVSQAIYAAGTRGWNTGYSESTISERLRLWSADNFREDLLYNPRNGGIYYWNAASELGIGGDVTGRGVDILDLAGADGYAPSLCAQVMVTDELHIVAFGANDTTSTTPNIQDPMLVVWSTQENPATPGISLIEWLPAATNTAGNYRLTYGSLIVTAEKQRQEILIWTDSALYSMRYLGAPYVYGFNPLSAEITIVSPNAVATANNITYWMGQDKFYAYSGRVDTLPCSLRQYVFDDFSFDQQDQICCGTNEKYNEVWWFYVSQTEVNLAVQEKRDPTIDRYVVYNYLEKLWYYGNIRRTAWLDSHIAGNPFGAYTPDLNFPDAGLVLQHEVGTDDQTTADPQPIAAYIESADFDIGDGGDKFSFVKRLIPDIDFIGSNLTRNSTPSVVMTLSARNYPGQGAPVPPATGQDGDSNMPQSALPTQVLGTAATTQVFNYTNQAWIRLRGRQVYFRVSSDDLGVKWQLGVPRLDIQPDGRR